MCSGPQFYAMRRPIINWQGNTRARNERGFTLIENMIALVIFAIGIMAIVYLLVDGMVMSKGGQSLTQAYIAADEMAGMLRTDAADALSYNGMNTSSAGANVSPKGPVEATNIKTWEQSLQYLPGLGGAVGGYGTVAVTSLTNTVTCPCTAVITVYWAGGNDTYAEQTVIGY